MTAPGFQPAQYSDRRALLPAQAAQRSHASSLPRLVVPEARVAAAQHQAACLSIWEKSPDKLLAWKELFFRQQDFMFPLPTHRVPGTEPPQQCQGAGLGQGRGQCSPPSH